MRCEPKTAGVAAAADEALCTESVYERADLNADGIVDFFDFATLGAAWKSLDPDNCPVAPISLTPMTLPDGTLSAASTLTISLT